MKPRVRPWNVRRLFRNPLRSEQDVRADIDDEFAFHLDLRIGDLISEGVSEPEARRRALEEFGDREAGAQACAVVGERLERRRRAWFWLDELRQDTNIGFRLLRRSPGFSAIAVATLALGIGANTAIYSVLDTLLIRPLTYPEPDRLVQVSETLDTGEPNSVSGGAFADWEGHQTHFAALALTGRVSRNLRGSTSTERLNGLEVTAGFFPVLGVPPLLGRGFVAGDDQPGARASVVLTEELWRSRFGGDPSIVGSVIVLDEVPHTVVGVMPAGSWVIRDHRFFVPAVLVPGTQRASRSMHWAAVFGRLAPGSTIPQAEAELKAIKNGLASEYPAYKQRWSVVVQPAVDAIRRVTRGPLLILLAAVSLVLLIACANVASLLIARGFQRQQELAVRTAVGATGARLVRQVLTENGVLAVLGGVAGVAIAAAAVQVFGGVMATTTPLAMAPRIDARALIFTAGATVITGLLAGLLPALRARRPDLNASLGDGGRGGTSAGRVRTQRLLVVVEVAMTVVLLTSAALLLRSLAKTAAVDPGFDPARSLAFDLSLPDATYSSRDARFAFVSELLERIRRVPGVSAAGSGTGAPFGLAGNGEFFRLPEADPQDRASGRIDFVSPGYLEALGARLRAGRLLAAGDNRADGARVIVINEAARRRFFASGSAIDRTLWIAGDVWRVVGVVEDIADFRLDVAGGPFAYAPRAFNMSRVSIVVRTPLDPDSLVATLRREVERLDAGVAMANPRPLDRAMSESVSDRRVVLGVVGVFAIAALVLATIGVYGVMAYAVVTRRRELGIRLALGARRAEIVRDVLRSGLAMTGVGLAVGVFGVLAAGRVLSAQLYQVSSHDPAALAATAALVAIIAIVATLIPAIRAGRVDPVAVLRSE